MSQIFINNAKTTLFGVVNSGDLVIPVVDAASFPTLVAPDFMIVTLEIAGVMEVVKLAAPGKVGNTLIVDVAGRGWENTTPLSFPPGSRVEGRITAGTLSDMVTNPISLVAAEEVTRINSDIAITASLNNEIAARVAADSLEVTDRNTAISTAVATEVINRDAAIAVETAARTAADVALSGSLTNISSIGVGQTWQIVSRSNDVVYTNSTGRPIVLCVSGNSGPAGTQTATIAVDGVNIGYQNNGNYYGGNANFTAIIPNGSTYSMHCGNGIAIAYELR